MKTVIVFTDPGSVDVDDWLALLLLRQYLAEHRDLHAIIITTHHYAVHRAKMVWSFFFDIPPQQVTLLVGVEPVDRESFDKANPLFPSAIFGSPFPTSSDERKWFPKFGDAFASAEAWIGTPPKFANAASTLPQLLAALPKEEPIYVCVLAPPHDILSIPEQYYSRMRVYAMGGWQENGTAGYNWGLCPEIVSEWLARCTAHNSTIILVSSGLVRKTSTVFPLDRYERWNKLRTEGNSSPRSDMLLSEWDNCNRGNKLQDHKNLCDPLALYLALSEIFGVDCALDIERGNLAMENRDQAENYFQLKMSLVPNPDGTLENIVGFSEQVKHQLLVQLEAGFENF